MSLRNENHLGVSTNKCNDANINGITFVTTRIKIFPFLVAFSFLFLSLLLQANFCELSRTVLNVN